MLMDLTSEKRGDVVLFPVLHLFTPISHTIIYLYIFIVYCFSLNILIIIFSYLCFICLFDLLLYLPVLVVPDLPPCSTSYNPFVLLSRATLLTRVNMEYEE